MGQDRLSLVTHPERGRGRCGTAWGILCDGALLETGTLAQLAILSASPRAPFDGTVPIFRCVAGVERRATRRARVRLPGPWQCRAAAPGCWAGSGAEGPLSREPSLRKLFLAHYGEAGTAHGPWRTATDLGCPRWRRRAARPATSWRGAWRARPSALRGALWGLVLGLYAASGGLHRRLELQDGSPSAPALSLSL